MATSINETETLPIFYSTPISLYNSFSKNILDAQGEITTEQFVVWFNDIIGELNSKGCRFPLISAFEDDKEKGYFYAADEYTPIPKTYLDNLINNGLKLKYYVFDEDDSFTLFIEQATQVYNMIILQILNDTQKIIDSKYFVENEYNIQIKDGKYNKGYYD